MHHEDCGQRACRRRCVSLVTYPLQTNLDMIDMQSTSTNSQDATLFRTVLALPPWSRTAKLSRTPEPPRSALPFSLRPISHCLLPPRHLALCRPSSVNVAVRDGRDPPHANLLTPAKPPTNGTLSASERCCRLQFGGRVDGARPLRTTQSSFFILV